MIVRLEEHELDLAAQVGCRRRLESVRHGREDRHGFNGGNAWELDIQAAAAELAVAKAIDAYWDGSVNTFKRGDVGNIQVRSTSLSSGALIVRPSDADDDLYVLVVGKIPEFNVVGFRLGLSAKQERFSKNYNGRPPAWFVPQSELVPIEKLQDAIEWNDARLYGRLPG